MGLIKTSFYSAINTTVTLIVKLITNKVVSHYLGQSGMFLLGQLKDFISLARVGSNLGTEKGVIKYVAEYKNNKDNLSDFLGTSFKLHIYASIIIGLLTIIFKDQLSTFLFKNSTYSNVFVILAFSFVTVSVNGLIMSTLNGFKKIKTYIIINIIVSIISATIMIVLILQYGIVGAFYAIGINQILVLGISFCIVKFYKVFNLKYFTPTFKTFHFKNLTKFSAMAIVAPLCMISATLFVRSFLNNEFGDNYAGSWEAMWRLSAIYIMFLATTFQFYLTPTFSVISGKELKREVFKVWSLSVPIITVIIIGIYVMKDFIITFLFSKEFFLINSIILFHLLGDFVKINSWVLGNILISKAKTKVFILFQIGWAITFSLLGYIFVKQYGFVGISISYFVTYILHFLCMNIYFRKLLWVK